MYAVNIPYDYEGFTKNTQIIDDENHNINIILKHLFSSIPGGVLYLSLIGLISWTINNFLDKHFLTYE